MLRWDRIAERRMRKAEMDGTLRGLAGEGEPLPEHPELAYTDPGTAIAYRIMAESGALPREVALRKRIAELHESYAAETDPARRREIMAELADVEMRHAMEQEARKRFIG
ncbi:DUF1992 domain-containing protein [Aliiruegeria sabulilitoris]|uniref:DnaJ family domain-containing protein n=1 Tax=Aliiruegeria sabulilitoris TaxID=1510458 RepID=UPI000836B51F|nr:DUF1992 domain-containing protein [Aliiruegeria sabulilitoris]NDR56358.1 DUF1992 domain-containing protein [Pseudoruegeria sp. M32A2M]